MNWWGYKVAALTKGLVLINTRVFEVIHHQARPGLRSTVAIRKATAIDQVVSGMWAPGSLAEDAGQEGAASGLALNTIRIEPW